MRFCGAFGTVAKIGHHTHYIKKPAFRQVFFSISFPIFKKKLIPNLSPKLSTIFLSQMPVDKSYPQTVDNSPLPWDNYVDISKNAPQTVDFATNFFLWIMWISFLSLWITMWITQKNCSINLGYPHYPQLTSPYPSLCFPHTIHSFLPLIHMLSPAYPQYYPQFLTDTGDIFYTLLSSSLLKFFIIFSIISLYGLTGSFLENYHIPTSGVTND